MRPDTVPTAPLPEGWNAVLEAQSRRRESMRVFDRGLEITGAYLADMAAAGVTVRVQIAPGAVYVLHVDPPQVPE